MPWIRDAGKSKTRLSPLAPFLSEGFFYRSHKWYIAPVDRAINIDEEGKPCQLQTRVHRLFYGNDFGEGTIAMHSPVFHCSSPSGKLDGLILEHGFCLDGTAKLTQSHSKCETRDPQFPQAHGVSGEGTSTLNPGSSSNDLSHTEETGGTSSSDQVQDGQAAELQIDSFGSANENGDRGTGGTLSSDHLPTEPGSEDRCPVHGVCEDNWQRLTTMVDPLLAAIFQGACSLLAYESSNGSSLARDAIYYVVVFVCVLGFLFAFGGRWFRCAKMEGIGLLFAGLGFLLTMALVVIYKIG